MATRYSKITPAVLVALVALLLTPALTLAQSVEDYRAKARADCFSLRPKLATLKLDYDGAIKYANLQTKNAGLRDSLKTKASELKTTLDAWCTAMATVVDATAKYAELKTSNLREVFLPLFAKVGELDAYYGKLIALENTYEVPGVSGIKKDRDDFATFNNAAIIGATADADISAAVTSLATQLTRAGSLAPTAGNYTDIYAQTELQAKFSLQAVGEKVKAAVAAVAEGQRTAQRARTLLTDKLTKAAWENVTKTGKSPEYVKIYDANRPKVDRIKLGAIRNIDATSKTLNGLWVPNADPALASGLLNDANTVHLNAALRTNLRNRVESARTALAAARAALLPSAADQYYTEILTQLTTVQQLKLQARIQAMEAAISFHRDLGVLRGATAANADTENGLLDLQAGMTNPAKRGPVEAAIVGDPLITQFAAALGTIDLAPLTGLQTAFETKVTQVVNPANSTAAGFVHANSTAAADKAALAEVRAARAAYGKALGTERSDVHAARKVWLAMVTKAANSGAIADLAPYAEDLRTKKILDDFDRNRKGLKEKVAAIVTSRKAAIDRNQAAIIAAEPLINAADRVDFATYTTTIKGQLDTFQTDADAIDNYEALKAKVLELKYLGVNNVYLPAQRQYLGAAAQYPRLGVLMQVNDLLIARANALPNTVAERDLLIAEASALDTRLDAAGTALGAALTGPLKGALDTREDATADSVVLALATLDTARGDLRAAGSEISAIRGAVGKLFGQIKAAEASAQ